MQSIRSIKFSLMLFRDNDGLNIEFGRRFVVNKASSVQRCVLVYNWR